MASARWPAEPPLEVPKLISNSRSYGSCRRTPAISSTLTGCGPPGVAKPAPGASAASASAASAHQAAARRRGARFRAGCANPATDGRFRSGDRTDASGCHFLPSGTGVERRHLRADGGGILAEVLLVDLPVVADDERHHAAPAVLGGVGDHREAGDH